jgi:hypothetical protein
MGSKNPTPGRRDTREGTRACLLAHPKINLEDQPL